MNKNMKEKIASAYYELVIENGIENTSLSKVGKKAGVNPSLIFHYYDSKEDLISHFFDQVLAESRKVFMFKLDNSLDVYKQFEDYIDNIIVNLKYSKMDSKAYYTCYVLALRNNDYKMKFLEHKKKLFKMLEEIIIFFTESNVIKPGNIKLATSYIEVISDGIANMRDFMESDEDDQSIAAYFKSQLKKNLNYQEKQ